MSILFLNQSAIHYESLGRGRPVLFLHTWVGSWQYWLPAMQLAAASCSAYAVDLYGFGESAHDEHGYSLEQQALLVQGFLDEMGIGRIALVGHGLGALVGLAFAADRPSSIGRLLAVALPLDPASIAERLRTTSVDELRTLLRGRLPATDALLPAASAVDGRAVNVDFDAGRIKAGLGSLAQAEVPCVLVYGANDPLLSPPSIEATTALGSTIHQVILQESGHFPMTETPEAFNRLLIDFLALEPGADPHLLQPREEWRRRIR